MVDLILLAGSCIILGRVFTFTSPFKYERNDSKYSFAATGVAVLNNLSLKLIFNVLYKPLSISLRSRSTLLRYFATNCSPSINIALPSGVFFPAVLNGVNIYLSASA